MPYAKHKVGDRVRLETDNEDGPNPTEFGIVISVWDTGYGDQDCYVAFFGHSFPVGEPTQKPYVLRYFGVSLERVADAG